MEDLRQKVRLPSCPSHHLQVLSFGIQCSKREFALSLCFWRNKVRIVLVAFVFIQSGLVGWILSSVWSLPTEAQCLADASEVNSEVPSWDQKATKLSSAEIYFYILLEGVIVNKEGGKITSVASSLPRPSIIPSQVSPVLL